jgi:hypothetical protein
MGLFQVNIADKWHKKRNPDAKKLYDPAYNMTYQFAELVIYERKGIAQGLKGAELAIYVSRFGQRPNWGKCSGYITTEIKKAYKAYNNALIKEAK